MIGKIKYIIKFNFTFFTFFNVTVDVLKLHVRLILYFYWTVMIQKEGTRIMKAQDHRGRFMREGTPEADD